MASIAEIMAQSALQSTAPKQTDLVGSFAKGAELAMHAEQLQKQSAALEQQGKQMEEARLYKFAEAVEKGQQYSGKAQSNYYNKFLPQYKKSLGLDDMISDDAIAFNGADENMIRKQAQLISLVNQGRMSMQQAIQTYHDPQKMADIFGGPADVQESTPFDKNFAAELNKAEQHRTGVEAQMQKQQIGIETAGQVQLDKDYAKEYSEYEASGGKTGLAKNIKMLDSAIEDLKKPGEMGGNLSTAVPGLKSEAVQDIINKRTASVQRKVRAAILGVLRQTLGPQFTENEGERIMNLTYNPRLSDEENIRSIKAQTEELKSKAAIKANTAEYFRKHGTLRGLPQVQEAAPVQQAAPPPSASLPKRAAPQAERGIPAEVSEPTMDRMPRNKLNLDAARAYAEENPDLIDTLIEDLTSEYDYTDAELRALLAK